MPTVAFHTLGCKVNQGETAAMAHLFREAGYQVVDFSAAADVYVINTCAVTVQAEQKSRQVAHRAREENQQALIVMAGCYPQVAQDRGELPEGIDLLVGSSDKPRIVELVERARQASSPLVAVSRWSDATSFEMISASQEVGRTRATLKIQDGCQQFCAYCIIPYARGPERSRPVTDIVQEARDLVEQGFQEIVMTGIHVGSFGQDLPGRPDLADLVEQVLQVPGLKRLRLSSIEPNEVGEKLMQLMQQYPNFCRHLHIPLQAGQDRVLKAMNRRYDTAEYRNMIDLVRTFVPEVAITTDIIVGFPGETAEEFEQTYEFVKEIGFSRLHVFRYSRRPGTPAADMPQQVPKAEKSRRSRALIALGKSMAKEYAARLVGSEQEVLWESQDDDGIWTGHTDTYVTIHSDDTSLRSNLITRILIDKDPLGTVLKVHFRTPGDGSKSSFLKPKTLVQDIYSLCRIKHIGAGVREVTDCIFCKIVAKEIASDIVYEDEQILAFRDINPVAPVHILVVPKRHIKSLRETQPTDEQLLGALLRVARQVADEQGLMTGYRVAVNIGKDGGQVVEHLHLHVIGGKPLGDCLP